MPVTLTSEIFPANWKMTTKIPIDKSEGSQKSGGIPVAGIVLLFALFLSLVVSLAIFWIVSRIRALNKHDSFSAHELWEERYLPDRKRGSTPPPPVASRKFAHSPCELESQFPSSSTENLLLNKSDRNCEEKRNFFWTFFNSGYDDLDGHVNEGSGIPLRTLSHQVAAVAQPASSSQQPSLTRTVEWVLDAQSWKSWSGWVRQVGGFKWVAALSCFFLPPFALCILAIVILFFEKKSWASYEDHWGIIDKPLSERMRKIYSSTWDPNYFKVFTVGIEFFFRTFQPRPEERKKVNF